MASHNIKIHDHCTVAPPPATPQTSLSLTFFDLFWLRFHPVERIFFYTLPTPESHPSTFFSKVVPNLKTSLSRTLQHFPPLAGNVVWPNNSPNPIVQYTPGDVVSLTVAESDADFNHVLDNSPHDASESRSLVPHLESSDSRASALSLQITFFPNRGFTIGISTHHAVLDGKSSTVFIKAWASQCRTQTPSLAPEFEPFFDKTVIKAASDLGLNFTDNWSQILTKLFPHENSDGRCLKLLPFPPRLEDAVRATFALARADLDRLRKRVLSKWDTVKKGSESNGLFSKPPTLSSFVLACAHVLVCIAKAFDGVEEGRHKFGFGFTVDCRARLEPPIPDNYCGNCVWGHMIDTEPLDFIHEEGVVIVAKRIHGKIKEMLDEGVFHGAGSAFSRYEAAASEGVEIMGIAGSNRFGVYGTDFGWGKPAKVEITSVDRALTIALAESGDGNGGVEVGLVLNKHVMDLFGSLFRGGVSHD
ncbi:Phenolic glucoside malonyltransferase 1 [Spatholobus suberectus]|nr:Phenolic glucoside malonyltransferase 1 [Spatholobus suberectus]